MTRWSALLLGAALALAGCAGTGPAEDDAAPGPATASSGAEQGHGTPHDPTRTPVPGPVTLPSSHVHGVAVNPADGHVYLATHDGLYRMTQTPERVGPVIDLMGFTGAGPDHFLASGHPGPGTDLPNPVGLIESRDGGETWTPLSRQGESDFHALAAAEGYVVGFDGTLRATPNGTTWTDLSPPVAPYDLAVSPDGAALVATSESGPIRSQDAGRTWMPVDDAPLLQLVDWSEDADLLAGVTPDGQVAVSTDAGATWEVRGSVSGPPQALDAVGGSDALRVVVVAGTELVESRDGGATFVPYRPGP